MATAILSATFNAFAFAGAGFLFSKIDHKGYSAEMKRHNEAMEQMAKDRDEWNEARLKELDRVQNLRYKKQESERDMSDTNHALEEVETRFSQSKPILKDYYKPSKEMNNYTDLVKLGVIVPVSYLALTAII